MSWLNYKIRRQFWDLSYMSGCKIAQVKHRRILLKSWSAHFHITPKAKKKKKKKKYVFRVTVPYLIFLVKPNKFCMFLKKKENKNKIYINYIC